MSTAYRTHQSPATPDNHRPLLSSNGAKLIVELEKHRLEFGSHVLSALHAPTNPASLNSTSLDSRSCQPHLGRLRYPGASHATPNEFDLMVDYIVIIALIMKFDLKLSSS